MRSRLRRFRIQQPNRIPTGPLRGLEKRPETDRRRALALEQVRALANAAAFAENQGRALNALLTISWRETPRFSESSWSTLQTELFDKLARWLRRHATAPAFIWVRERVTGIGAHTHAMLHLGSNAQAMKPLVLRYLEEAFDFDEGGLDISMGRFGANTLASRAGLLRYISKGMDHAAFRYVGMSGDTENIAAELGIRHRGQQGMIAIKRAGVSQNIGPAARRRAGWVEIRDLAGLHRVLNPESGKA